MRRRKLVHYLAGDFLDLLLKRPDRARSEASIYEVAILRMLGRIHVEQMAKEHVAAFDVGILGSDQQPGAIEENFRLACDFDDIGMLGDCPERIDIGTIVPIDRRVLAQICPLRVGIAVLLEMRSGNDFECVELSDSMLGASIVLPQSSRLIA